MLAHIVDVVGKDILVLMGVGLLVAGIIGLVWAIDRLVNGEWNDG